MEICHYDYQKLKEVKKYLKLTIDNIDNHVNSEGKIIIDPKVFHENLRDVSINCADMIRTILRMEVNI